MLSSVNIVGEGGAGVVASIEVSEPTVRAAVGLENVSKLHIDMPPYVGVCENTHQCVAE